LAYLRSIGVPFALDTGVFLAPLAAGDHLIIFPAEVTILAVQSVKLMTVLRFKYFKFPFLAVQVCFYDGHFIPPFFLIAKRIPVIAAK